MNKKVWVGWGAAFVTLAVLDAIVNMGLLTEDYKATAQLWRPEGEMKVWLFYVVYAIQTFFLSLVFSKGYEGKGVAEGARYGLYMGLLLATPMAYGSYAAMPITYSLALKWFLFGTVEYIVVGIVLAMVYGKQATVTPVTTS